MLFTKGKITKSNLSNSVIMEFQRKPLLGEQAPFAMFVYSFAGVFIIGLIIQLLGALLGSVLFDVSLLELVDSTETADINAINALKFTQIIGALGTFVFGGFLMSFLYTGSWTAFFPFGRRINGKALFLIVLILIISLPFVNLLTELNAKIHIPIESFENYFRKLEDQTESLMMTLVKAENVGALLVNIFMIAIIPAFGEELVFRGLIQKHFTDLFKNGHVAILVTAIIFSLAHFQVYSFLPRFFLGLILGYAFYYGKSLWYPMMAHLTNNFLGVLYYYMFMNKETGDKFEQIGTIDMLPAVGIASLILVSLLMFYWVKMVQSSYISRPHHF